MNFPLKDYQDIYHILQTEKPAYIHWRYKDTSNPERFDVTAIEVSAEEEILGEGFRDNSQ